MVEAHYHTDYSVPAALPQTRKLGTVNTDFLRVPYNDNYRPLDGPCITLYVPNKAKPIELWNIALVTLGRADSHSNVQPMIDLSPHHANLLGVSRIHAEIFYRDGNYFVKDRGSTNGTWVNNHKLEEFDEIQLSGGDSLRLGHLMIQIGGC